MPRVYDDLPDAPLLEAIERGRDDIPFFSHYFCRRKLHDGQVEWVNNANATINVLPTGNRYGKTSTLTIRHCHKAFYKIGAEPLFMFEEAPGYYVEDRQRYLEAKYFTVHTAGEWEQAKLVWEDFYQMIDQAPRLKPWIRDRPRTLPPHIDFLNGSRVNFRTLGDHGSGIDGHSFYYISIDEAGWIQNLEEIIRNVGRLRIADVKGQMDIVGTMKPGISRDFYRYARRAAISTGRRIIFDHRDGRDYSKEREKNAVV